MDTTKEVLPIVGNSTFICAKDNKSFKSAQALRMHEMRAHTRAGKMGARWKMRAGRAMTGAQTLAEKRAYNTRLRARNVAMGLTTRGTPRIRRAPQKRIAAAARKERARQYARKWYRDKRKGERIPLMVYPDPNRATDQPDVRVEPMRGYIDFQPKFRISIEMLDVETKRKE